MYSRGLAASSSTSRAARAEGVAASVPIAIAARYMFSLVTCNAVGLNTTSAIPFGPAKA